jgi:CheY-like chemotaxis protein
VTAVPATSCLDNGSPSPEFGSTFLPVERCSKSPDMKTILIIEDHPDIRASLQELLQWSGHQVHVASTGAEGVSMFATHQPQVALVNIGLPGMNGYEVARKLRAAPGGGAVYMVALTGWAGSEIKTRAFDAGFDQHVTKPFDVEGLISLLTEAKRRPVEA